MEVYIVVATCLRDAAQKGSKVTDSDQNTRTIPWKNSQNFPFALIGLRECMSSILFKYEYEITSRMKVT